MQAPNHSSHSSPGRRLWLRYALAALAVTVLVIGVPDMALAQQSPMGQVICGVIALIYGNLGRGLAVLAVIVVGIGATLGKVSWGLALTVAVGIGTVFGAVPIVVYLLPQTEGAICYGIYGID